MKIWIGRMDEELPFFSKSKDTDRINHRTTTTRMEGTKWIGFVLGYFFFNILNPISIVTLISPIPNVCCRTIRKRIWVIYIRKNET